MKVSYFPGCTLKTKAKELDVQARKVAEALGVTMEEIKDWQCCGGAFTTSMDEIATKLSSVRALKEANEKGQPLVTVCSACHNVIKQTNDAMKNNEYFSFRANNYMAEGEYHGEGYAGAQSHRLPHRSVRYPDPRPGLPGRNAQERPG